MGERAGWDFEPGEAIVAGRLALERLGGGERFETWLAWDEARFCPVVAKVLRPTEVDDDRARRELAAEAELALRLRHPVVVRGFDAVIDGPRPHLVLEHLEGPTLRAALRHLRRGGGGRMTLDEVVPLGLQLCSALHYLAAEDVVHLDVKPSNIVMGPVPRLIDLSVARSTERAAALRSVVGTRLYMAPEQADPDPARRGRIGPAADIWAVGVCLFEASTGRRPFTDGGGTGDDDDEGRHPQLDAPRPLPWPAAAEVPEPLVEVVERCLAPDPADRPSAAELAAGLEPLVAAMPTLRRRGRRGLGY